MITIELYFPFKPYGNVHNEIESYGNVHNEIEPYGNVHNEMDVEQ